MPTRGTNTTGKYRACSYGGGKQLVSDTITLSTVGGCSKNFQNQLVPSVLTAV